MDWGKAKNYIIIFLVFLNIVLFFCNLWFNKRYVIKDEQINAVKTILDSKNINTELCSDIPLEYEPMVQLSIDKYFYDEINIRRMFFGDESDVKRTSDFDKTILSYDDKTISIIKDTVEYEDLSFTPADGLNEESILSVCGEIMDSISEYFDGFEFYSVNSDAECYCVEYIQKYKGTFVFNNYVTFKFYNDGKLYIKLKYFPVKSLYGEKVDICSADEAFYIFSQNIKKVCDVGEINVLKIEKGWYFDDSEKEGNIISMPYYRIKIKEREEPFFINAYNRTFTEPSL